MKARPGLYMYIKWDVGHEEIALLISEEQENIKQMCWDN
jgi:hypothetical protein